MLILHVYKMDKAKSHGVIPAVQVCIVHKIVSFTLLWVLFYVEWVKPRAMISAVKCALYIKLSHRSVTCLILLWPHKLNS